MKCKYCGKEVSIGPMGWTHYNGRRCNRYPFHSMLASPATEEYIVTKILNKYEDC